MKVVLGGAPASLVGVCEGSRVSVLDGMEKLMTVFDVAPIVERLAAKSTEMGRVSAIVCSDDDIMPWPSCHNMNPPMEHYPLEVFATLHPRDRRGKFRKQSFCCDRCDRMVDCTSKEARAMRELANEMEMNV